MDLIERIRVEVPEATIAEGAPQTDAQIDALAKELGFEFPDDYRAILRDHGAVAIHAETFDMYGDLVVWGIGIDGIDIRDGVRVLDEECRSWSCDPLGMLPVLGHRKGEVADTHVYDPRGQLRFHHRGRALQGANTLTEALEAALEKLKASVARRKALETTKQAVPIAAGSATASDASVRAPRVRKDGLPLDQFAVALGMPLGPLAIKLAQRYARGKLVYGGPFGEPVHGLRWLGGLRKEAFNSTWGRVVPLCEVLLREAFVPDLGELGLVVGGETTDECVCVVYRASGPNEGQARVVAKDVRDLLSLFAINTTGFDVVDEQSARHARRLHFATYDSDIEFIAWLESLGIQPAEDPLALVLASGLERDGRIDLSKNVREEA